MPKAEKPREKEPEILRPKLTPRPRLFKFLCFVFAVWMLVLLAMYFFTVYPLRHPHGP